MSTSDIYSTSFMLSLLPSMPHLPSQAMRGGFFYQENQAKKKNLLKSTPVQVISVVPVQ